jgi:hypothetical protein
MRCSSSRTNRRRHEPATPAVGGMAVNQELPNLGPRLNILTLEGQVVGARS